MLHMRLNPEGDRDIIAWLDAQPDKTAAVKAAIRRVMGNGDDLEAIVRRAVISALDERGVQAAIQVDPELEAKLDDLF